LGSWETKRIVERHVVASEKVGTKTVQEGTQARIGVDPFFHAFPDNLFHVKVVSQKKQPHVHHVFSQQLSEAVHEFLLVGRNHHITPFVRVVKNHLVLPLRGTGFGKHVKGAHVRGVFAHRGMVSLTRIPLGAEAVIFLLVPPRKTPTATTTVS
jgi:hypothetical protein